MNLDFLGQFDHQLADNNSERKVILFQVSDIICALDIMSVMEILNPLSLIPIHHSRNCILGMTDYRQAAITVIDLRLLFGGTVNDNIREKWIITQMNDGQIAALVVDKVNGVSVLQAQNEREQHKIGNSIGNDWSKAVFGSPEGLVFEIDLDVVVAAFQPEQEI